MFMLWWYSMSIKPLKILIALDCDQWLSCVELSKKTNYSIVEIGAHLKVLRRLKMVEMKPRTTIKGEKIPPSYKSNIKILDPK